MQRSDDMLMAFWNPKRYRQLLKKDIKKRPFSPKVKKEMFLKAWNDYLEKRKKHETKG